MLSHLMTTHQIEFELAEGRRVQVPQITDTRHSRFLAQQHPSMTRTGDHGTVVSETKPNRNT